jgi:hypothetical protein
MAGKAAQAWKQHGVQQVQQESRERSQGRAEDGMELEWALPLQKLDFIFCVL